MNENRKALFGFLALIVIGSLLLVYLPKKNSEGYKQSKIVLDTYVTIMVRGPKNKAKKAVEAAFKRMETIEKKLNRYDAKSEVARINKFAPKPVKVSKDTFMAAKLSLAYAKLTGGKFDITVGPLVKLFDFNKKKVPSKNQVAKAKRLVNWRLVELDAKNSKIALAKKEMVLDLGGMSKGFASDEAYKVLKRFGIKTGLIDTGSSTFVFSASKGERPWRVGLRHPRKDSILTIFKVRNLKLSTSGDYQQYYVKSGRRYHHIIDPQTGYPAKGLVSVTILSKRGAAESDILSTAVFALGARKGYEFVAKLGDTDAVLIASSGKVMKTRKNIADLPAKISLKQK